MSGRLRPFQFLLVRDQDELAVTFYALSERAAVELAREWAAERGWTVEGSA